MANKTVLVTGSSRGLGKSIAILFASKKYNVILNGRNKDDLGKVRNIIKKYKVKCDIVRGDVTKQGTLDKLYKISAKRNIDILINNAGIYTNKLFQEMFFGEFRKVIDVNLIAPIQLIHKLFPIFIKNKSGLIININSITVKNPNESESAYSTSKCGLQGFTKSFQIEANKYNLRVMDIYFGAMNTAMTKDRKDFGNFIDTVDAAKLIYQLCKNYKSLRIKEVEICRRIYSSKVYK
jgi:3-oxoacyl-[acyl-carrier protein] reductase